ncbi:olfactory receptor 1361-like [Rana temporaria]|uniref:olfactory receptor 1361-like n=1 Tax=Rana temporaria TaxID=8407 RepID=UPI001AAE01BB|nr:olfactory receptor 1361-like [Rana temporaria]
MSKNQSFPPEFILLGLSDLTASRIPLSLFFHLVYAATVAGNLLIIFLVNTDSHLQTPMYFFLGNLSVLDTFMPSCSVSHLSFGNFSGKILISYSSCVVQVFFFSWFAYTEFFLLAIMSYDRYVAICLPLHYTTKINIKLCVLLVASIWIFSCAYSLMHTLSTRRLSFPDSVTIPGLFCELFQLIQLSSSDTYINYLLIFLVGVPFALVAFSITFLSYFYIVKTILRIKMKDGRRKAFSTCSSHLTVVFMFYVTTFFNYIQPKNDNFLVGRLVSVLYTFFTPFLNPVIYSLRNKELKGAVRRALVKVTVRL